MGTINEARDILEVHKTSMFERLKGMHAFLFAENIKEASRVRLKAEIVTKDRLKKARTIFNEFTSEVTESDHHTINAIKTMLDLIIQMDVSAKLTKTEGVGIIERDRLQLDIHSAAVFISANSHLFTSSTVALEKVAPPQPIHHAALLPVPTERTALLPVPTERTSPNSPSPSPEPEELDLRNAIILSAMKAARSSCKTLVGFGAGNDRKRKDVKLQNLSSEYENAKTEADRNKALVNFLLATADSKVKCNRVAKVMGPKN